MCELRVRVTRRSYKCIPRQVFPIIKEYTCNSKLIPLSRLATFLLSLSLPPLPLHTHAPESKKKKKWTVLGNPGAWSSCARPSVSPLPGIKDTTFPIRNAIHIANRSLRLEFTKRHQLGYVISAGNEEIANQLCGFWSNSRHQRCGGASRRGRGEVTPIYSAIKHFLS